MDEAAARHIAQEAAEKAVAQALLKLGIDTEDPKSIIQFQQDLSSIRELVHSLRDYRAKGTAALLLLVLTAAMGALWVGIKSALK